MARIRHTCRRVKPYGTLVPDSVMPAVSVLSWPGALPRRPLEVERGRSVDRVEALIGRLAPAAICDECIVDKLRSEEHTSELQSLMRISYAGFCLKKKNNHRHTRH